MYKENAQHRKQENNNKQAKIPPFKMSTFPEEEMYFYFFKEDIQITNNCVKRFANITNLRKM